MRNSPEVGVWELVGIRDKPTLLIYSGQTSSTYNRHHEALRPSVRGT